MPPSIGKYVDVFVPIAFKKLGGRKTIVAPNGTQFLPGRSKSVVHPILETVGHGS